MNRIAYDCSSLFSLCISLLARATLALLRFRVVRLLALGFATVFGGLRWTWDFVRSRKNLYPLDISGIGDAIGVSHSHRPKGNGKPKRKALKSPRLRTTPFDFVPSIEPGVRELREIHESGQRPNRPDSVSSLDSFMTATGNPVLLPRVHPLSIVRASIDAELILDFPFTSTHIDLPNGLRISYIDAVPLSQAPVHTVLLLHGLTTWSYLWRQSIAAFLRKGYRVIAPDLPGYGKSDRLTNPDEITLDLYISVTKYLLFEMVHAVRSLVDQTPNASPFLYDLTVVAHGTSAYLVLAALTQTGDAVNRELQVYQNLMPLNTGLRVVFVNPHLPPYNSPFLPAQAELSLLASLVHYAFNPHISLSRIIQFSTQQPHTFLKAYDLPHDRYGSLAANTILQQLPLPWLSSTPVQNFSKRFPILKSIPFLGQLLKRSNTRLRNIRHPTVREIYDYSSSFGVRNLPHNSQIISRLLVIDSPSSTADFALGSDLLFGGQGRDLADWMGAELVLARGGHYLPEVLGDILGQWISAWAEGENLNRD